MVHSEVQVNLTEKFFADFKSQGWDLLTGVDSRTYVIEPDGNYFINPERGKEGHNLVYNRWGGFLSGSRILLQYKVKIGLVTRLDRNDYFSPKLSFRATAVYSPSYAHNFRIAYQNGYRYPSIFEAFSNVNSGGVKRVGGLRVMSDGIFEYSWLKSSIDAFQAAVNRDINTAGLSKNEAIAKNKSLLKQNDYTYLDPEHILSLEGGYRGIVLNNRLFIDVDFYLNQYRSFIAQVEVSTPNTRNTDSVAYALFDKKAQARYRMWTNSKTIVHNYGSALKLQYNLGDGCLFDYNVSYTKLVKTKNDDGLEDGFNTPKWMMNLSLTKDQIFKHLGGGVLYRWQDSYYWQSFLVNGDVPAQGAIDVQVNYSFPHKPLRIRIGANNLLNHYEASFLGGPQSGGFYYAAMTYSVK